MASSDSSSSSLGDCGDNVWVTLRPQFQRDYNIDTSVGFRLRIDVVDACGCDGYIFRYYQKPMNLQGEVNSVFSGVCSWPDMEELPIGEPESDTSPAGFRLNYIDLVVDSETIATEIWELIKLQADELVQTIKDGQNLETMTDYTAAAV